MVTGWLNSEYYLTGSDRTDMRALRCSGMNPIGLQDGRDARGTRFLLAAHPRSRCGKTISIREAGRGARCGRSFEHGTEWRWARRLISLPLLEDRRCAPIPILLCPTALSSGSLRIRLSASRKGSEDAFLEKRLEL